MMFNEKKFKAKLIENGLTISDIAKSIGVNEATIYRKMCGKSDFSRNEMSIIKDILVLNMDDFELIFFAKELA